MDHNNNSKTENSPLVVLLTRCYTKNQAIRRLWILEDIINFKAFKSPPNSTLADVFAQLKQEYASSGSNPHYVHDFLFFEKLDKNFYEYFSSQQINTQLQEIENALQKAKSVIVYVPFEMPEEEIERLGVWFKQNLGPAILYELMFDPNLIGGCAVSLNGVYKDYSLRQKILDNKQQVLSELSSFRKQV